MTDIGHIRALIETYLQLYRVKKNNFQSRNRWGLIDFPRPNQFCQSVAMAGNGRFKNLPIIQGNGKLLSDIIIFLKQVIFTCRF